MTKTSLFFATFVAFFVILTIVSAAENDAGATRLRRGLLSEEAERIVKEGHHISIHNVGQLVDLVDRHQAGECLARVICELTNNSHAHGDVGARFAKALLSFRQSKHPRVKYYLDAMTTGAKTKTLSQCRGFYPTCGHSTNEIINVGAKVLRA